MTDYKIIWTNDPPRYDLDGLVRDRVKTMQDADMCPPDHRLDELAFLHIPILEEDYNGPSIFVTGNDDNDLVCTHEPVTESGGPKSAIRLSFDEEEDMPDWLQQILDDTSN